MNSSDHKLELKKSIELVMHCLQPTWREENMDDDGYWDDEIITKAEYSRVKAWWITSGSFESLCQTFIESFETFFPEISSIGMNFLPYRDEWVAWIFEIFEWWPNEYDELAERVIERPWINDLSYEYLNKCTKDRWDSTAPIKVFESVRELTKDVTVFTKDAK